MILRQDEKELTRLVLSILLLARTLGYHRNHTQTYIAKFRIRFSSLAPAVGYFPVKTMTWQPGSVTWTPRRIV